MGMFYQSQKLCQFWHVTKPFLRLETFRGTSSYSFCVENLGKLKSCRLSSSSSKFNSPASYTVQCQTSSLLNETIHKKSRTLTFSHSKRIKDHVHLTSHTRKFSKSGYTFCKSTKDECSEVNNIQNPTETEQTEEAVPEWTHPSSREDSVIKKDSQLRSILHDLASDFGEDKSSKPDDEKLQDEGEGTADNEAGAEEKIGKPRSRKSEVESARKTNGVLSLVDIVEILRRDNAQDICVIKVPKELQYVDYFVVVTGRSTRHLKAMTSYLNKMYKMLRKAGEPFVKVEGKNSDDWMCVDFGDIVVHFMLPETRELYELEMLWTLGPEYDDQYHRISEYQANISQPVIPTEEELEELQSGSSRQEGYSVVIRDEGEKEIPDEKRI